MSVVSAAVITAGWFGHQLASDYLHPGRLVRAQSDTPATFGVRFSDITLTTKDGVKLAAWYTPPENGAVILVAHGRAAERVAEHHALFARAGYGVLSWDARAHGASGGDMTTIGLKETLDAEAALDFALKQKGVEHVGGFGQSMGAATLIRTAATRSEIEAVISDSCFTTLTEALGRVVPSPALTPAVRLFAQLESGFSPDDVQPVRDVGRIAPRPVFIIQGGADETTGPDAAERLYEAAGEPKAIWVVPGVNHVAVRPSNPTEYDGRVLAFLDSALLGH